MRILFLSTNENRGGAANAQYRIYQGLKKNNIETKMIVINRDSNDLDVIEVKKLNRIIRKIKLKIINYFLKFRYHPKSMFSLNVISSKDVLEIIEKINPDLIHLNWINAGMISIKDISNLNVPIVWTLHDMWAFTGGCHYSNGCLKFQTGCGNCPVLNSRNKIDLSSKLLDLKNKFYSNEIVYICPSKWLKKMAKESLLLNSHNVKVIPNGIDSKAYKKKSKSYARKYFKIDSSKSLVLFGAMSSKTDERKGFELLQKALIKTTANFDVVIFGTNTKSHYLDDVGRTVYEIGNLNNDEIILAYSTADVMVVPSKEDNLPNTVLESLFCSLPVVAFNIGGLPDMISHKKNGFLASPFSTSELAEGIDWIINHPQRNEINDFARKYAINNYDIKLIVSRHIELYKTLIPM